MEIVVNIMFLHKENRLLLSRAMFQAVFRVGAGVIAHASFGASMLAAPTAVVPLPCLGAWSGTFYICLNDRFNSQQ